MARQIDSYNDWVDIPAYYFDWDSEYAMNLGKLAAKKCLKRYTDSQVLKLIRKGRAEEGYDKRIEYLSYDLFFDEFRFTKEYYDAVDKYTEHIKHTAMKVFGKRRLQKYFGKLSDDKLIKKAVDTAMEGYGDMDIFPYENIDFGFAYVIEERIRDIGKKMKAKKATIKKAKKATVKKTKQVKRKVRK